MRSTHRSPLLTVPLLFFALTGCSLGRDSQILEQYALGGAPPQAGAASSEGGGNLTIGMKRLDLAPYLATPAIVVRRGPHQIVTSEYHRWAGDPGESVNRAVAAYLAVAVDAHAVDVAPWTVRSQYDYLIQLHLSRFEGAAADTSMMRGTAHMLATWEIVQQRDGIVLARGVTDYTAPDWKVGDYAALVTLLDRGLSGMAQHLANCLQRLVLVAARTDGDTDPVIESGRAIDCRPSQ